MDKLTITVDEMAASLGISRPKAYDLTRTQGFPVIRVGRRIVIPVDGLRRWVDNQTAQDRA